MGGGTQLEAGVKTKTAVNPPALNPNPAASSRATRVHTGNKTIQLYLNGSKIGHSVQVYLKRTGK
jgi:hypothetical protein